MNKLPRSKPALSADRLTRYSGTSPEEFVSLPAGRQVCRIHPSSKLDGILRVEIKVCLFATPRRV